MLQILKHESVSVILSDEGIRKCKNTLTPLTTATEHNTNHHVQMNKIKNN